MSWFEMLLPSKIRTEGGRKKSIPEGLWIKCQGCSEVLYQVELERSLQVCPKCAFHHRMGARRRLETFLDLEPRTEIGANLEPMDVLKFRDTKKYKDRLIRAQKDTEEKEALIAMIGKVQGLSVVAVAFEFRFMGGSMASVVGERFVRAVNLCLERALPLVCFSASGGARMQEALISLMQMAKTSAALARMRAAGLPYISVMTDPTMGGVSASLAMLGDINVAEPNALIGFAGPRVIEQTVRETLPTGFQRSEFLLDHGAVDIIVPRNEMRNRLANIIAQLMHRRPPEVDLPRNLESHEVQEARDAQETSSEAAPLEQEKSE